jgi:mono/diheme cytochrome c family protein
LSRRERRARIGLALSVLATTALPGCWEQWSETWFPQMKWQKAVQPFERVEWNSRPEAFLPPEGAVPVEGAEPRVGRLDLAAADALVNPRPRDDLRSLENGKAQYAIYCTPCHGAGGMGDGPVSNANPVRRGPFGGVFPLVGLTTGRSDGYLYNVIRIGAGGQPGFRMPSYQRVPAQDRWDIVNYVRYLDRRGGRP